MKDLKFVDKIEKMDNKEITERIKFGMEFDIPHKIRPVPYMGKEEQITEYIFDELVARCPMTRIKDHYKITIRFIPEKLIPELKSLKLYLWDYEECLVPISHEHLAAKIFKELKETLYPQKIYIELDVAGRGEIFTRIRLGNLELSKFKERYFKNM